MKKPPLVGDFLFLHPDLKLGHYQARRDLRYALFAFEIRPDDHPLMLDDEVVLNRCFVRPVLVSVALGFVSPSLL